ncbi:MAG TPA: DmsE family decaheme c-type cytochrome [Usitatibacter sp.]|nr:DmsE family decaheme c-type cytochrome [Usitatibacter sp.]
MRFRSSLLSVIFASLALVSAAHAEDAAKAAPTMPICANCHEQQAKTIVFTAHGAKNDASGSMCQACHGDASEHLKDPMKAKPANPFSKSHPASAAERTQVCLACHSGQRQLAFWESGLHAKNDVTCANCHSMHGTDKNPPIGPFTTSFRPNEADLCGTCHKAIRADIMKPSHHPVVENKIKCSDCHNPHGAQSHVMLRNETVNAQCTSCHTDKRGPFVFSHPPVDENCLSCHNPHGSIHYRLLNEHIPNLCQDCHDWSRHPGTFYQGQGGWICQPGDTSSACAGKPGAPNTAANTRLIARSCLNCHNSIHGSNAPAARGQFLTR